MRFDWMNDGLARVSTVWDRVRDASLAIKGAAPVIARSISQRLSARARKLVLLALLVLAFLLGVDVGITHQKAISASLAATAHAGEAPPHVARPPIRRSVHPNRKPLKTTPRRTRSAQKTPPPRRVRTKGPNERTCAPIMRSSVKTDPYRVYQPGTLTSSGINGY
ncbi:MAG: hypothetical protein B7Z29_20095 [Hyphomicrobium sp. 12-62-95]|nr:MAG: hypothetical protein B7Z29_20095 [Hyphomicrobium sp. 12-62-95]